MLSKAGKSLPDSYDLPFERLGDWLVYFHDNHKDIQRPIRDEDDSSLPWLPRDVRLSANTLICPDHEEDIRIEWEPIRIVAQRPMYSWKWEEARVTIYAYAVPIWRGDIRGNGKWINLGSSSSQIWLWLDGLNTLLQIIEHAGDKVKIKAPNYKEMENRHRNAELERAAERLSFNLRQYDI